LDKPSGWVVNDAETTKGQKTVQDWLRQNFQFSIFSFQEMRNGIVHRLDKETSGILLVAKTPEAFVELQRQFKERIVKKTYFALVHGKVEPAEGEINAPVGRTSWNRERFGITLEGKEAKTKYKVLSRFTRLVYPVRASCFSLVELYPESGRTHQIRVHMQYRGYPLVGDEFYAGKKTAAEDRKWCPRVFLHAAKISFLNPKTGKPVEFKSSLPEELENVLSSFRVKSLQGKRGI
ncbi:RluA family pseudouridine synthase, partial [Candidatus Roizmanbacteria bacterium CG_4_10_14_0_2_um_filter_36_35]